MLKITSSFLTRDQFKKKQYDNFEDETFFLSVDRKKFKLWLKFKISSKYYCYCFDDKILLTYEEFSESKHSKIIQDINKGNILFKPTKKQLSDCAFGSLKVGDCYKIKETGYTYRGESAQNDYDREYRLSHNMKLSNKIELCISYPFYNSFGIQAYETDCSLDDYVIPFEASMDYKILI